VGVDRCLAYVIQLDAIAPLQEQLSKRRNCDVTGIRTTPCYRPVAANQAPVGLVTKTIGAMQGEGRLSCAST
jgi:hypothetical protein